MNPSTKLTEQVCLRRCMFTLQKLQLWLLGIPASPSHQMEKLLQPCGWLLMEPVHFPLAQLQDMVECLFPSQIMRHLPPPAASAAKINVCFLGSAFEHHVLMALFHPWVSLPLDNAFQSSAQIASDECSINGAATTCCSSVFMHTLHCMRMSVRQFVQSFNIVGKPSHPLSLHFLKFMHVVQVWFVAVERYYLISCLSGIFAALNTAAGAVQLRPPETIAFFAPFPRTPARQSSGDEFGQGSTPNRCIVSRNTASHRLFTWNSLGTSFRLFYPHVNARHRSSCPA